MKLLAACLLAAVSLPAFATTVMVMSLSGSRVELLVDNRAVRSLRIGEASPEGVKLLDIRDGAALLEFDGRRWQMRLGSSTAASVMLQADERGHFVVNATVNGARRVMVHTAGGARQALFVRLASVRIGDILVQDVEATVSEANELPVALLGMSLLNQLELQRSGRTLTLTRRH